MAEEKAEREEALTEQMKIIKAHLPVLLKRLRKIQDPRNPKKCKHKMTVILIYGILTFVFQMSSRREANREMTRPMFMENLRLYFPELADLPHNDTLMRLLSAIEVAEIEEAYIELVRRFVRNKKFRRYLIGNCYPVAVDGTQKFVRSEIWSEECLERKIGKSERRQYYVYVLEACLAFHNGMTIPLMSEFLSYPEGDTDNNKQDCELKAFHRLMRRLKKKFPRLPVILLLDGLYANGPVAELCAENKWQFMIVLKDNCLRSVWEEFNSLRGLEKGNRANRKWGNRKQHFEWVNGLEYRYGEKYRRKIVIHVVVCEETWEKVNKNAETEIMTSRHAWISSEPLNYGNVHERCNMGARHRWGIETGILVEKRHGYNYEHCFSYNWSAMKGYHYLMKTGHLFTILAQYSECLIKTVKNHGLKGFIRFIRETVSGPWPDEETVFRRLNKNFQLRLA
ncbi:H repeat-associated protein N-terminal domain-containing protein [Desulfonema magnum]|uniref:H repeat-associated protein N-terminal domain-containing protein n=1 Tax=Desulfonema magnum TaxID=45655 RepID=A0A975BTG2_9BACT|nr:H repeat-associated protein N-terminal domain-containing protein [Desulfonema magnum]QTA91366.1 H repeat-associated protein N-terminal domain-containing protein [Desulfonema magnum]